MNYFNSLRNQNINEMKGDQTGYMFSKKKTFYLHEAMISYKAYKVKAGNITKGFLKMYYNSLEH